VDMVVRLGKLEGLGWYGLMGGLVRRVKERWLCAFVGIEYVGLSSLLLSQMVLFACPIWYTPSCLKL
jgi:hypothetical protein